MDIEFWIDSTDQMTIEKAKSIGLLHGITTNPSILARCDQPALPALYRLLDNENILVAAQVTATDFNSIIEQATKLSAISNRLIVKIPCTFDGYRAMRVLRSRSIPCLATAIYTFRQFLIASEIGVMYAAPYLARMIRKNTENGMTELQAQEDTFNTITMMLSLPTNTKLMLAAISKAEQIDKLIQIGVKCLTLPSAPFNQWISDCNTTVSDTNKFIIDWNNSSAGIDWVD